MNWLPLNRVRNSLPMFSAATGDLVVSLSLLEMTVKGKRILTVREIESSVDLVKNVHWCTLRVEFRIRARAFSFEIRGEGDSRFEPQERHDERERNE